MPPPMIVMPAASIFARSARVASGGSVRGTWTSLNVIRVTPSVFAIVERLIERELAHRVRRHAQLQSAGRGRRQARPYRRRRQRPSVVQAAAAAAVP